jgi:hypothetical protein
MGVSRHPAFPAPSSSNEGDSDCKTRTHRAARIWTHISLAVMPRAGGASSIPEAYRFSTAVSGMLDRPVPSTPTAFVRRRTSAVKRFRRGYAFRARRSFSEGGKPGDDNGERSRLKLECEAIALSRRPGQARDSKRRSGTHSHRRIVLSTLGPLPFATTQAGGYGSPPSGTTARDETAGGNLRARLRRVPTQRRPSRPAPGGARVWLASAGPSWLRRSVRGCRPRRR